MTTGGGDFAEKRRGPRVLDFISAKRSVQLRPQAAGPGQLQIRMLRKMELLVNRCLILLGHSFRNRPAGLLISQSILSKRTWCLIGHVDSNQVNS